jgi:outer membrane protein TolC
MLASVSLLLALSQGACQTYERRPLDLGAHRGEFLSRLTQSPVASGGDGSQAPSDAVSSPSGFDVSDGLSLAEAEVVALVYNADLRVARLEAGVAKATAEETGRWDDPTIGVDVTRLLQGGPNPWKVLTNVGLTLPISGRLRIEKERAGLDHAAKVAGVAEAEWRTRMSLRRAWACWSSLHEIAEADRAFIERLDRVLTAVDALERANEITRAQARLFRIERAQAAASLAATLAQRQQAELDVRHLMGVAPTAAVAMQPEWPTHVERDVPPQALAQTSPALLAARAEYEVAERSLELEIRKQYPDLFVAPGFGREDGEDQALLNLLAPVPIINANRRGIAQARAHRETVRARAEGRLEDVMSRLAAARARAEASAERRRLMETQVLPLVEAQLEDARRTAELGEVDVLVLLESLRRQADARRRAIEARLDETRALIDCLELTGPAAPTDSDRTPDTHARRNP